MKQLGLNYPCQKTKVFIAQAVNQLKSVTNNVLIHMLLQIQVSFCEKQNQDKSFRTRTPKIWGKYLKLWQQKVQKIFWGFFKNFLACLSSVYILKSLL